MEILLRFGLERARSSDVCMASRMSEARCNFTQPSINFPIDHLNRVHPTDLPQHSSKSPEAKIPGEA
jgi:hypothetical protein